MNFFKHNAREFITGFKKLRGNPHYVSLGMAIGIFVSLTPTLPFHTLIAVALAFILRGSKRASIIGVWFCNPVTLPLFYVADYKVGRLLISTTSTFDFRNQTASELIKVGLDIFYAMMAGGVIIGLVFAVIAYFITHWFIAGRNRLPPENGENNGQADAEVTSS